MVEIDVQTVSIAIASAGVLVAVIYYIFQLRHQTKVRETDLVIRMNSWMNVSGSELTDAIGRVWNLEYKDYGDFVERYGPFDLGKAEYKALQMVLNYFEGVGLLLKRKLMDIDFVWNLFGTTYLLTWEQLKPVVEGMRKEFGTPDAWNFCEYLYNEMKKRKQKPQRDA